MKHISDQQQRQAALDPRYSFIVRAPAGSGKTELLIRRFLALLARVNTPEEIIAITFTRKATAEMRKRIISALQSVRENQTPENEHQRQLFQLAREVIRQDEKQHWQLQDNPGRLHIQTIDSLCATIVIQMPLLSGLGIPANILDDADEMYTEAAERTIAALHDDDQISTVIAQLLLHCDNKSSRLSVLLKAMLQHRDQWLRHIINHSHITRQQLDETMDSLVGEKLKNTADKFAVFGDNTELIAMLNYAAGNLSGTQSAICHCAAIKSLPVTTVDSLPQWHGVAELLLTKSGAWRKQLTKNNGFPIGNGKTEKERGKKAKETLKQLIEQYQHAGNGEYIRLALVEIRKLAAIQADRTDNSWFDSSQWQIINKLLPALIYAEAQLRVLFAEHGKTDFIAVQQAALHALEDNDQYTDLALQLDYKIQHILVDEFQDISVSQYQLLEKLTAGWSADDGRTLFLVGDPMQSIYRFREAEVGNFLSTFSHRRLGQVALKPLTLALNFRSQQGVVEWVNDTFSMILPKQQDIASGAVSYSSVNAATDTDAGEVTVHPLFNDPQEEAHQVIKLITELEQVPDIKSVAILGSSRRHLEIIIRQLKKSGIGFQATDVEALNQRPAIQDCLALTKALLHPADRIAWLSILRAPWCGLSLSDLYTLAGQDHNTAIWDHIQDEQTLCSLSHDGQKRLLKFRDILHKALAHRRRKSLRRLVEMVWMECGGPATLSDRSDLDNIDLYLAILQQHEEGGDLRNVAMLEKAVEKLYATADLQIDKSKLHLEIMTIHKAKGLEFDVVILPGLGRKKKPDDKRLLLWQEQQLSNGRHSLLLAPIKKTGGDDDPLYQYIDELEKSRLANERDRLLYVATTRARKQLHLFGIVRPKETHADISAERTSLLHRLWPAVENIYKNAFEQFNRPASSAIEEQAAPVHAIKRLTTDWQRPLPKTNVNWNKGHEPITEETEIEFSWATDVIRQVGIIVHYCLYLMAEQGPDLPYTEQIKSRQSWFKKELQQRGIDHNMMHWATTQICLALNNMINDERGQWILSDKHRQQKNEYRLTGSIKGNNDTVSIIIDRTFVDADDTRWIIDYKTSYHRGQDTDLFLNQEQIRYQQQLEKYAQLMRLQESRPIKLGLYFPLLQGWRAWQFNG